MNKFLLILVSLPIFALSSCEKAQPGLTNDGNTIELSFVDTYNGASSVATRATSAAEGYEKTITSLVLLVYPKNATNSAPLIKYVFSANEREKLRAVIPLGSVTSGSQFDFYVIANASDKYPILASTNLAEPTISDLYALLEDKSLATYNKGDFSKFATEGVNQIGGTAKGFVMSDKQTVAIEKAGSGTPTKVNMRLNRTVARVDVTATVTDKFKDNYGQESTLTIKSATIKFEPKQGYVIAKSETMAASIANASLVKDSLIQDNYSTTQTAQGKFRYYPYPCFDRHATALNFGTGPDTVVTTYDPSIHKHMLLTIVAEFSYEEGKVKTINYKIPLTGTDKKGGLIRNYLYNIQVNIDGLTDQEIKAKIEVADWEVAVTQEVNIGG